jgi:predicted methyltransferase
VHQFEKVVARAVGPNGVVYGQNPQNFSERATAAFEARTKTPAGKPMVGLSRPFDDPLPADARDVHLITFLFFYHDTTYMGVDRAQMNAKLFAALKPGGYLVIADHSAAAGAGATVGKSLHRIEESTLRREVRRPVSSSWARAISGIIPRIHAISPRSRRPNLPTSSC